MKIGVYRTQHHIGQGGFHSSFLSFGCRRIEAPFCMVVDCGGSSEAHRRKLASDFAQQTSVVDVLAISHLDADHINGLPDLQRAGVEFSAVFVPHVPESEYMLWMTLKLCAQGSSQATLRNFILTAIGLYGGSFGPVVRVASAGSDTNQGREEDLQGGERPSGETPNGAARRAISGALSAKGGLFSCSQSLTLNPDWQIRFYSREWRLPSAVNAIWQLSALSRLRTLLSKPFGSIGAAEAASFAESLLKELSAEASCVGAEIEDLEKTKGRRRKKLKAISARVAKSELSCKKLLSLLYASLPNLDDYNDASMCVYAGPAERGTFAGRELFAGVGHSRSLWREYGVNRAVAWMHTGDASFRDDKRVSEFLAHYKFECPNVSVFVLPHHGSRHSFDPFLKKLRDLAAEFARKPVFLAPADPCGKYGHPHGNVVDVCHTLGDFSIVDSRTENRYLDAVHSTCRCCDCWRC